MAKLENINGNVSQSSGTSESVRELCYKLQQLQVKYENCIEKNQALQKENINREKTCQKKVCDLNDELIKLRETKMHVLRENIMKECAIAPRWFNSLTKSVNQEKIIKTMTEKMKDQEIKMLEKDETISSLEWKIEDLNATVTILKAENKHLNSKFEEMPSCVEEQQRYDESFVRIETQRNVSDTGRTLSYENEAVCEEGQTYNRNSCDECGDMTEAQTSMRNSIPKSIEMPKNFTEARPRTSVDNTTVTKPNLWTTQPRPKDETVKNENYVDKTAVDNAIVTKPNLWTTQPGPKDETDENENYVDKTAVDNAIVTKPNLSTTQPGSKNETDENDNYVVHNGTGKDDISIKAETNSGNSSIDSITWETFDQSRGNGELKKEFDKLKIKRAKNESDDPWISPLPSPVVTRSVKESMNAFWKEDNSYPSSEVNDSEFFCESFNENQQSNERFENKSEISANEINDRSQFSDLEKNLDVFDTTVCQTEFISENSEGGSWNLNGNEATEGTDLQQHKNSLDNLWDFEPDSIVDVSTGETIYESGSAPNTPDRKAKPFSYSRRREIGSKSRDGDSDQEDMSKSRDFDTNSELSDDSSENKSVSTVTISRETSKRLFLNKQSISLDKDDNEKKVIHATKSQGAIRCYSESQSRLRYLAVKGRKKAASNQHHGNIEFVRKSSKKEREALDAYKQWRTQGKNGDPPANYKISLC